MNYVVLDIEFNGRKFASELPMEVIEIGAVRLDDSLRPTGEFASLIRPVYFSKLNSFIKKKTGIPQEAINKADGFRHVIGSFRKWLAEGEPYMFVTWGGEDVKRIVFDARMHKLDDAYWMNVPYFDLLKGFLRYKNVTNDVSVEAALEELGIASDGAAHRALDDARMTGHIFRSIFPALDLSRAQWFKDSFTNARERRMVKQAIRTMKARKMELAWTALADVFLKDKVALDDPRKAAELQAYFAAEMSKAQPLPDGSAEAEAAGKTDDEAEAAGKTGGARETEDEAEAAGKAGGARETEDEAEAAGKAGGAITPRSEG